MRRGVSCLLLAASAGLIGLGLWLGQNQQVLRKAAQICLECIGVG